VLRVLAMMGDRVGGLDKVMRQLNLSTMKKKGIKLGKKKDLTQEIDDWHAVGKAMTDRPISVEVIQRTLGWIWCGDGGMTVKDAGENKFLFASGGWTLDDRALSYGSDAI
jgi:hypothetical protein